MKHLLLLFVLIFNSALAKKVIVAKDGSGDFTTIQEALNNLKFSQSYQTIYIKNGTYAEKIFVDKSMHHIKFIGESAKETIITYSQARDYWRCENPDDFGAATFNVLGSDLIFKNLTILNSYGFEANKDVVIECLNESGKTPGDSRKFLPRETGEKEGTKMVRLDGHQFAFRSMDGATRMKFYSCIFRSGGGDTVSPWDVNGGMFYFKDCVIEGHVDLYCPRGNAIIENSLFICHNLNAAIWHDGSAKEEDKSVLINCRFVGDEGFKLGRYHREAQMYLINCSFSKEMADAPIYQEGDRDLQWGHRVYYKNCQKDGEAYPWYADNTTKTEKDFTFKKVFGKKW
ncbi:pectinesterase family protein [Jiulongibacter sediminis]|jgi:pectinesterase|uniref:pectinesterase family protein n=1 Tax=Jiulongibacter sediminis TaxID=1605367 RepID=UPI0026F3766C|nr:pectinesterase family protein [Jiulongibacter sediminis]